jgi:hypothetical protein
LIQSVSREAEMVVKVIAEKGASEIIKFITNDSFRLVLSSQNNTILYYQIISNDIKRSLVTLKLNFTDPTQISASTIPDMIELSVKKRI